MSSSAEPPLPLFTRRTVLTGALGLGAATVLPSAAPASAAVNTVPQIFGCAAWGARPSSEPVTILSTPPERIIVHHTATSNVEDYTQQRAFALARAIQDYHMDTQGWIDTGQHFTISRGAFVTEGRHQSLAELNAGARQVRSAHCVGQNTVAVGIENEGTYTSVEPPARQYAALAALCTHICSQYGLPPSEIYGHRDFNNTACPGDRLYALLPRLRQDVALQLGVPLLDELWQGGEDEQWDRWPGASEFLPPDALERALGRALGRQA
ncbi:MULTISPECIES: peptidoglycan recognition family protein [unclassified Streptomyces]|uniref:peptidoglycan recognition protein family protein n=1 Tax=unclassified Streptomyces TaxID=2593676 RepID=UPI001BE95B9B|nr:MULTISPECIES: peptidoglycan recognition family protein [unclassified Streptomyces]MBT2402912.1 N-acetylmuramoyl-L-alanine amidase [Streptomyces sp. ISL-21]MBT2454557.1 N-acetylmuramoyl-L-alanine amidase [Streptomyces sp. ISL-86]MBT2613589.1 N-acetylmuramoyl-L-alanine amidase [Streptomyces sp. ISL-87]